MGFLKIRDTILGVPTMGSIVFCGPYWGPLSLVNYQMGNMPILSKVSFGLFWMTACAPIRKYSAGVLHLSTFLVGPGMGDMEFRVQLEPMRSTQVSACLKGLRVGTRSC